MMRFAQGGAYFACPANPDLPKRVMMCVGRDGSRVMFCQLGGKMYKPDVMQMCGREVAQVKTMDIGTCTISAASEADLPMAMNVAEAMK